MTRAGGTGAERDAGRLSPAPPLAGEAAKPFSTARVGISGDGYQDNVKRQGAWEEAHDGEILLDPGTGEWTPFLAGNVPFPFAEDGGLSSWDLRELLGRLDRAERAGLCPVHGTAS